MVPLGRHSKRPELHSKEIRLKISNVEKNKVQLQGMVALVTGSIWCVCVHVYECQRVIMGWLNRYIFICFQCLFIYYSAILSHVPSRIMRSGSRNRWGLGQACSFVVPYQTWDSPARQVVLKT